MASAALGAGLVCCGWAARAVIAAETAEAQSVELAGIAHAAFRVSDLEKTRSFYERLGFEPAFEFSKDGKTSVSYIKVNDQQFIEIYQKLDESQAVGFMHVCFESENIEALRKEYVRRGLDAGEPRKAKAGNLLDAIHDPDGRLIEFTQYMPGSLHFEDRGKHLGEGRVSQRLWRVAMPTAHASEMRNLYGGKLGFIAAGQGVDAVLRLPGKSGEEVAFLAEAGAAAGTSAPAEPEIVFEVADIAKTAGELRARGFAVRKAGGEIRVKDPDGVAIGFAKGEGAAR
jgi:catechol 2,3-dioxygenase-like lactoylglutathione lyase family enzyme